MAYIGNVIPLSSVNGSQISEGTVTGDKLSLPFNYDSATLYLDNTNNRVGIGTASPSQPLQVIGNALIGATPATQYSNLTVVGDSGIQAASPLLNFVNAAGSARFGYLFHGGTGADFYLLNQENGSIRFGTNNSERARIDSSGNLLVSTSTSFGTGSLKINNNASIGSYFATSFSNAFFFVKSRSATVGQFTVVQSGDELGQVIFQGTDGSANITAAAILAYVDGTPGTNDMPGRLVFSTTADGAASPTERLRITSAGNVGIGTASPAVPLQVTGQIRALDGGVDLRLNPTLAGIIGTYSNHDLPIYTNGSEKARIDTSGRLLVGTSSSFATKYDASSFQAGFQSAAVVGTGGFFRYSNNTDGPALVFSKSRSDTLGTQSVVLSEDTVGFLGFTGSDGTAFQTAATIRAQIDGTPGTNDMPGRLTFSTTADGAASPTERMRITSAGRVGIGTTSPGTAKLDVVETGTASSIIRARNDTTTVYLDANNGYAYLNAFTNHPLLFGTNNAERARIDSSGRLLVGASSAALGWGNLQSHTTSANAGIYLNFANDTTPVVLTLGKSRGNLSDFTVIVQSGDQLGSLRYVGTDGTGNLIRAAQINGEVDGTPGANDMPGRLTFSTTADGAASPTERMRIKSTGIINFSNTPTYADNTAATAGGLAVGDVYRTVLGVLMIRF